MLLSLMLRFKNLIDRFSPSLRFMLVVIWLCAGITVWASGGKDNPVTRMSKLQAVIRTDPANVSALVEAGELYLDMYDPEGAVKIASRLETVSINNPDSVSAKFKARLFMGLANTMMENADDAYLQLSQALLIADNNRIPVDIIDANDAIGNWCSKYGEDFTSAIKYYNTALAEARALGDPLLISRILNNEAEAYLWRGDYSGIRFAREALEYAKKAENPRATLSALITLAHLSLNYYGLRDEVPSLVKNAREINGKYGYVDNEEFALIEGTYARVTGDYAKSEQILSKALAESSADIPKLLRTRLLMAYGVTMIQSRKYRVAIDSFDEALEISREMHYNSLLLKIYSAIAYCYEHMSDYPEAYRYLKAYQQRLDSLWVTEQLSSLNQKRVDSEISLNETLISRQDAELHMRQKLVVILISIGCMLLAVIALMWYFYRRKEHLVRSIVARENEAMAREKLLRHALEQARSQAQILSEKAAPKPLTEEKIEDLMVRFNELMTEKKAYTDSGISIKSVAEALDTNRTYLSNAINRTFNKSFPQILAEYRIRAAIEMMSDRENDVPLKAIAMDVGFSSPSIFYTTFRNIVGMTPAAYRATLK